jgi:hypothetical protein
MNTAELIDRLSSATSQTIISMRVEIEPKMLAKSSEGVPNPYRIGKGKDAEILCRKSQTVNGLAAPHYNRIVRNRNRKAIIAERIAANLPPLETEALDAEANARHEKGGVWFETIKTANGEDTTLCRNPKTGEVYIRFVLLHKSKAEYRTIDGTTVDKETIAPWLAQSSSYSNQGLPEGEEVIFLIYKIDSLKSLSIDGERITVE